MFSAEVACLPAEPATWGSIPKEEYGFEDSFTDKSVFLTKFFKKFKISVQFNSTSLLELELQFQLYP